MKKCKKLPPRHQLLCLFDIDTSIGKLIKKSTGKPVGWLDDKGYVRVRVNKITYYAHRIIYKMWHGVDPGNNHIDHRDGNKSNNLITNLRMVRHSENLRNQAPRRAEEGLPPGEVVSEEAMEKILLMAGADF